MKSEEYEGKLLVVEGPDGSGTTTQAKRISEKLGAVYTAEPGGRREATSLIGDKVDEMISEEGYSPEAIALAFAADRIVHVEEKIIPLLEKGKTVVTDRYYHSSLVYQAALGADFEWVKSINKAALKPYFTVILDVSAETGMERTADRGQDNDIFESLDFQQEVVERYRQLPDLLDEAVRLIDGSQSRRNVSEKILETLPDQMI